MKYRKKPVVIEAVQLTWETWGEMCALLGDAMPEKAHGIYLNSATEQPYPEGQGGGEDDLIGLVVTTVHGEQAIGRQGDWIIPDAAPGTFYPCKPDIFAATYEPVQEDS